MPTTSCARAGRRIRPSRQAAIDDAAAARPTAGSTSSRGAQEPRFAEVLKALVTPAQMERIGEALAPIVAHASR